MVAGRDEKWKTLLELSKERLEQIEPLLRRVDNRSVTRPGDVEPRKLRADAGAAVDHLKAGGKWKRLGLATPKVLRGRTYLKKDVLVDGRPADDIEQLSVVCDDLDLEFALADLLSVWKDQGVTEIPADRRLFLATLKGHVSDLERTLDYAVACDLAARHMSRASPPIPTPNWLDGGAQQWVDLIVAAVIDEELGKAARQVDACGQALTGLRQLHDVHPVVAALLDAIAGRDVTAYSEGYRRVVSIERTATGPVRTHTYRGCDQTGYARARRGDRG